MDYRIQLESGYMGQYATKSSNGLLGTVMAMLSGFIAMVVFGAMVATFVFHATPANAQSQHSAANSAYSVSTDQASR
jgi:hypothetical protein